MRATIPAVVAAACLLSACAGVPTSGPIEQGPAIAAGGEDQFIRVIARPPREGMTPEEVVRGFQEATASPDAGYTVARQYLTPVASTTWQPSAGVIVYDNPGLTFTRDNVIVTAEGSLGGTIDESGQYSVAAPGTPLRSVYTLERVEGEWRLAGVPQGLVLGRGDIDRGFRSFNLYYFTRDFTTLVPAPVTVPLSDAGLATQLVRGLIDGPTEWLAPAVRTAFPEGTRLALDAVPVVDGVADVALTAEVTIADEPTRQALSAQLTWTLRQLPDITGVRMTVNGQPFLVSGAGTVQSIDSWPSYDPNAFPLTALGYAIDERGLLKIDLADSLTFVGRPKPELVAPAVSFDSTIVAGLAPNRRAVWSYPLGTELPGTRLFVGTELSRPSWDRAGNIWVVDRGAGLILIRGKTTAPVPVVGLPEGVSDKDVLAVAVARDGTRMAILVRRGTRVEPMVARIERTGESVRVAAPRRIESVITEAVDLAWRDADTLVVLGSTGASSLEVLQLGVGTSRLRRTGAPEGAITLAAAPERTILVGADGDLFRSTGSTWARLGAGSDPVYPG
jgi:hypothetical protein